MQRQQSRLLAAEGPASGHGLRCSHAARPTAADLAHSEKRCGRSSSSEEGFGSCTILPGTGAQTIMSKTPGSGIKLCRIPLPTGRRKISALRVFTDPPAAQPCLDSQYLHEASRCLAVPKAFVKSVKAGAEVSLHRFSWSC